MLDNIFWSTNQLAAIIILLVAPIASADEAGSGDLSAEPVATTESVIPGMDNPPHFSWRSTIGTHYRLDTDNWLGTVRGWPHHYSIAYHPDYTDIDHEGIEPSVGRFSGERRYYNYTGHNRVETQQIRKAAKGQILEDAADDSYNPEDYETKTVVKPVGNIEDYIRQAMAAKVDVIQLVLGNVKPTRPEFKNFYENNGLYFKDVIYNTVRHFNTGEFANKPMTIYWQLGNEVNAYNRFHVTPNPDAETLDTSLQKILPNGDPVNAADYVEYYLAPAVEAIRAASLDIYNDPERIRIVCGSVSGIRKEKNRRFLDALLNTTVRGERAPSLRGKRAWELIDIITIHYAHGSHDVLEPLFRDWVQTNKVEGIWITEELGARGAGAYAVAQVVFRYLDFWSRHQRFWTPDSARITFWGDDNREHPRSFGRGKEALAIAGPFLRHYPLHQAEDEALVVTNADVESYVLRADADDGILHYAAYIASYTGTRAKLRQLIILGPEGSSVTNVNSIDVSVIDAAAGIEPLEYEYDLEDGNIIIKLDYELPITSAVIIRAAVAPSYDSTSE